MFTLRRNITALICSSHAQFLENRLVLKILRQSLVVETETAAGHSCWEILSLLQFLQSISYTGVGEGQPVNLLFLCVENSARSQMAEGLAKAMFGRRIFIESAGSLPSGIVQPCAVEVMREIGIDIIHHYSKSVDALSSQFRENLDFSITLCQERVCPKLMSRVKIHWDVPDPATVTGSVEEKMKSYRMARDHIHAKLSSLERELEITKEIKF